MKLNLKDMDRHSLVERAAEMGVDRDVAGRIFAAVIARGGSLFEALAVRGLLRESRERLRAEADVPALRVAERRAAADGFVKYLFELHDGLRVEAVRIPLEAPRYSVCLSTQVGCAMGCAFCETGRMGFSRNLATWEMVDQALAIRREADLPVRGAVFMGMGEPFANYDNVIRAARILCDPAGPGIAAKAITISTVGLVPQIRRYTREGHPFRLAVSLGAATGETRRALVPIEERWPLHDLVDAIRDHARATGDRVMVQYVLIRGATAGAGDAAALVRLLRGIPVRLSIIEVSDPRGQFLPPTPEELRAFRDALRDWGQPVVRRYSGGKDARAACGMLATTPAPAHP